MLNRYSIPAMRDNADLFKALTTAYSELVSPSHLTFCALNSEVCRRVLAHFGCGARVIPCQLVAVAPAGRYTVGFVGDRRPGKWDGHAVCVTDDWVFDGAITHVSRGLGVQLSECIAVRRPVQVEEGVIAQHEFRDRGISLRWGPVPPGYDPATVPREPKWIVKPLAARLATRVGILLKSAERSAVLPAASLES